MQLTIATTKKDEVIDITDRVQALTEKCSKATGHCLIFLQHTTCCVTTADLDPGTDLDLLDAVRGMLPQIKYRHPHNPQHAPDHILSSIIGSSLTIPFQDKQLQLGTWQRIVLIELDGPRERKIVLAFGKTEE